MFREAGMADIAAEAYFSYCLAGMRAIGNSYDKEDSQRSAEQWHSNRC
jgi:hypothetical protein